MRERERSGSGSLLDAKQFFAICAGVWRERERERLGERARAAHACSGRYFSQYAIKRS